ncbi:MAG: hypothetical protein MHM6MM_009160, partial [Cercozoa sp. M6MM]
MRVLLHNGTIVVQPSTQSLADWLLCDSETGRVLEVGSGTVEHVPHDQRIDLQQKVVLPGLHDAHCHVRYLGAQLRRCQLAGSTSLQQVRERVRSFAQQFIESYCERHSDGSSAASEECESETVWIVAHDWDDSQLGALPSRYDLDDAVRGIAATYVCNG